MLKNFNISTTFTNLIENMYSGMTGQVKSEGFLSDIFDITIGLRQGCNLSPHLFNIYINDLPQLLKEANCDPVILNGTKINMLAYADDMLLLSKTESGLKKSLKVLEIYCNKWQLVINETKTKIMIFNKTKFVKTFTFNNQPLDIVKQHLYLGIKFHSSGTFTTAIKYLTEKAYKAYFATRSLLQNCQITPKINMKLFDAVIKPILTYSSEIWGAFGIKQNKYPRLIEHLLSCDKSPYEKLHLKMCKHSLLLPRRASNMGCRAELGRYPIISSILTYIIKYYARINYAHEHELVSLALESQRKLKTNSSKTMTYVDVATKINSELQLNNIFSENKFINNVMPNSNSLKGAIKSYGKKGSIKCNNINKELVSSKLKSIYEDKDSKLWVYSWVKKQFEYEKYLDSKTLNKHELTRFRLSIHWLPIERLRYNKPKIERNKRLCSFCNAAVGNEFHVLMICTNPQVLEIRERFENILCEMSDIYKNSDTEEKFVQIMNGQINIQTICRFIKNINDLFKEKSN